jgi:2-phospho-L-lactate guanylyltransferase (CobY/MobA/RfbA family)
MRPFLSEEDCLRLPLLLRLWMGQLRDWDSASAQIDLPDAVERDRPDLKLKLDAPKEVLLLKHSRERFGRTPVSCTQPEMERGFQKLVFIGTDNPVLGIEDLQAAFQALDECEVVLGPATDGGYYLIGFSALLPALFSGISWGTSEVFRETVQQLETNSIRWQRLRESFDLDTYEDLEKFHHLLKESPSVLRRRSRLVALVLGHPLVCPSAFDFSNPPSVQRLCPSSAVLLQGGFVLEFSSSLPPCLMKATPLFKMQRNYPLKWHPGLWLFCTSKSSPF